MPASLNERDVQTALAEPAVWPNLSQAARMIGLTKSTLSKQAHAGRIEYEVVGLGQGPHVLPPLEVLRIGSRYRRVPEETLVDRLADFLTPRLHTDSSVIRHVLRRILDNAASHGTSEAGDETMVSRPQEGRVSLHSPAHDDHTAWFFEVEDLRANPAALAGAISFVSPEDTVGQIRLGRTIDDVSDVGAMDW
jgi:hypothetical protein